jgi:hypothetical protein
MADSDDLIKFGTPEAVSMTSDGTDAMPAMVSCLVFSKEITQK